MHASTNQATIGSKVAYGRFFVTKKLRERVAVILAIALMTIAAIAMSPASHAQDQSSYEKALTRTCSAETLPRLLPMKRCSSP